jgi:Ca2+:H+ antiporter
MRYVSFLLKTHRSIFSGDEEAEPPHWNKRKSVFVLAVATAFIAWMSEMLVHTVEPMTQSLWLSPLFVGVNVIPIIGNAAEHATAFAMAAEDKMDIAIGIAVGSSTQIALFVAPFLVLISPLFGHKLSLIFTQVELAAVAFAVGIVAFVSQDGETNWLEGALLLAVYTIIGLAFYLIPPAAGTPAPAPAH